jgi:putative hemolysin
LRVLCIALTFRLQYPSDTVFVNDHQRHFVPLKLASASATMVDLAYPTYQPEPPLAPRKPRIHAEVGRYRLRLAESVEDRDAACRLRFKVFNIEMNEGLVSSYQTGMDSDQFDLFCEHLLVEDKTESNPARRVVGTYRMQSGTTASRHLGYYSEQEFNFASYEPLRPGILELGRASIDREHRTPEVLTLLWRGIAQYANNMGLRYLIGCSSLTSKDPAEGWQVYRQLEQYRVSPEFETEPTASYVCPIEQGVRHSQLPPQTDDLSMRTPFKVPKLLKTYLAIGARICGPPAWDRDFGTIDFLTLLDLRLLSSSARNRFLAPLTT